MVYLADSMHIAVAAPVRAAGVLTRFRQVGHVALDQGRVADGRPPQQRAAEVPEVQVLGRSGMGDSGHLVNITAI